MRYRLFIVAAAVSLALCAATVARWLGGGWADHPGRLKQLPGRWAYFSDGQRGLIQLVILHHSKSRIVGPIIPDGRSPAWDAWERRFPPKVWMRDYMAYGFGFEYGPILGVGAGHHAQASGTRISIMLPFGFVAALFGTLPTFALWRYARQRRGAMLQGTCAECGYDLRATPNRCPECGAIPMK